MRSEATWRAHFLWILPLAALLSIWEVAGHSDRNVAFFFSYPSAVLGDLATGIFRGGLLVDAGYTLLPAILGLLCGAAVGGGAGFMMVSAPATACRLEPAVAFLSAFPVFAIAPMTLVWFGLGLGAKFFLAFIGCVFVFLNAAHRGGLSVPPPLAEHFALHGFSSRQDFIKLRLPYALDWLLSAFKMGANLALLGVFIGEFVASERGLARVMLNAGALYNVKRVLAAAVLFTLVAMAMMGLADLVHSKRGRLIRWVSVPRLSRI